MYSSPPSNEEIQESAVRESWNILNMGFAMNPDAPEMTPDLEAVIDMGIRAGVYGAVQALVQFNLLKGT